MGVSPASMLVSSLDVKSELRPVGILKRGTGKKRQVLLCYNLLSRVLFVVSSSSYICVPSSSVSIVSKLELDSKKGRRATRW